MQIKGTRTQSKCLIRQGNQVYLVNLNDSYFNKAFFMLWLKPKKAILLSDEEEQRLLQSRAFKSGVPIFLVIGISIFVTAIASNTLMSLEVRINIMVSVIIFLLILVFVLLFLKKNSTKDEATINAVLNRQVEWNALINVSFITKKEKYAYISRMIIGTLFMIALLCLGVFVFLLTGLIVALFIYIAALYILLGTSYVFPNKATIKELT